jgi:hypothetical protein
MMCLHSLFHKGQILEGTYDLKHYDITDRSVIHVVRKKRYRRFGSMENTIQTIKASSTNVDGFEVVDVLAPLPPLRVLIKHMGIAIRYIRCLDKYEYLIPPFDLS